MRPLWVQIPSIHPFWDRGRTGVCTSLSKKTMTVRVRSVPPFHGRLAETAQRRPEEPKSLVRFQKRPPPSSEPPAFAGGELQKGEKTYVCTQEPGGI